VRSVLEVVLTLGTATAFVGVCVAVAALASRPFVTRRDLDTPLNRLSVASAGLVTTARLLRPALWALGIGSGVAAATLVPLVLWPD
jgi:hypothetical protein